MGAPVPINLQQVPPSTLDWMRGVARQPNPAPNIGWGMRAVARQPNPSLGGWYPSTSTPDYTEHGAPVVGPWVEQLEPKLPSMGLLHRKGAPDVRVQILWNAGCQLRPDGAHVCKVFVQELGPADLIRFRLPNGYQGRARPHRVYKTPMGNYTKNPRAILRRATFKKAWLPASFTNQKPAGIRGSWVQVTPADQRVGLVRIPGIGDQQAYVFQVKRDGAGRLRALVRWKQLTNPRPDKGDAYLVHASVDKSKWYCRLMPHLADCVRKDITPAKAASNPGKPSTASVKPAKAVSAAAARARVGAGGALRAITSGRAKLVLDRGGIRLVT